MQQTWDVENLATKKTADIHFLRIDTRSRQTSTASTTAQSPSCMFLSLIPSEHFETSSQLGAATTLIIEPHININIINTS